MLSWRSPRHGTPTQGVELALAARPGRWTVRCRPLIGLIVALALWCLHPALASAHAHLVQADPAPGSVIARAPATGSFLFDEPLNPALTRVRIMDGAGHMVTTKGGHLAPGHSGELWRLPLPRLAPGAYSVLWTSESATDGHIMSSFYTFRVALGGGADAIGALSGGGMQAGNGSGMGVDLGTGAVISMLFSWLGQMAQALWLGALMVELLVLSPARRAVQTPEADLARAATRRVWSIVQGAPLIIAVSVAGEVISLALQGTGGDWTRALAPATLGGILSSRNGQLMLARGVLLVLAARMAGRAHVPILAVSTRESQERRWSPQAAALIAPRHTALSWEAARFSVAILAAVYMLLVALSGHAAAVSPLWLSSGIDWAHLMCTAAWVGGIAALAYGVMPQRAALHAAERAAAVLPLLDRFSPLAYAAVGTLALSGAYNAVSHLHQPSMVTGTVYGQLLMVKMGLVGLLMALSATHVYRLRPQIARARRLAEETVNTVVRTDALATVHEGIATLAGRLRLEAAIGAAVLLATVAMAQTLPSTPAPASAAGGGLRTPASITTTMTLHDLRAELTIAPPTVGAVTMTLRLWEQGHPVTADSGAAIIHLYPVTHPALRAVLTPVARGARFVAHGGLAAGMGTWRADVLVRTAVVNTYRLLPFVFIIGAGATFPPPGLSPLSVTLWMSPQRHSAASALTIMGVHASAVRVVVQPMEMRAMRMSAIVYPASDSGRGNWRIANVVFPLPGHWNLTVEARSGGVWIALRQFMYHADAPS